jgi:hypothetical protein
MCSPDPASSFTPAFRCDRLSASPLSVQVWHVHIYDGFDQEKNALRWSVVILSDFHFFGAKSMLHAGF